jgi:RHS repeat-associated protein
MVAIVNGTHRTEMVYNGAGQRVQIIEKENGSEVSNKRFVWVGTEIAEERDSSGANVIKRFYGQGLQQGGNSYFYARDHLGSVREMTDSAGTVQARYDFDPYGRRMKVSGSLETDVGFTGHYTHAPSGLNLTLYRAYDPELGRWLSRDPVGEPGSIVWFYKATKYQKALTRANRLMSRTQGSVHQGRIASVLNMSRSFRINSLKKRLMLRLQVPSESIGGVNLYQFCSGSPVNRYDPHGTQSEESGYPWVIPEAYELGADTGNPTQEIGTATYSCDLFEVDYDNWTCLYRCGTRIGSGTGDTPASLEGWEELPMPSDCDCEDPISFIFTFEEEMYTESQWERISREQPPPPDVQFEFGFENLF